MDFQFGSWKEGGNVRMVKHVVVIWDKKMVEGEMPTALSKQPAMELDASKPHMQNGASFFLSIEP